MSILADIYLSRDDKAAGYDTAHQQFPDRVQYRRFTMWELSILWSIMRGVEPDDALLDHFECLLEKDGGERMIHRLPQEMVTELAGLTPERIAKISPQWAAIEELAWLPEDAQAVVQDLARLSGQAIQSGRSVYIWNCV
jgi:hypothetical protein